MKRLPRLLAWAAVVLLLLLVPPFLGTYELYLVNLALVNIVLAVGLNLLTGNAGQISLCHSSFMAIGAYTTTLLVAKAGLSYWAALPLGGVTALAFGCLLALPAMRLSGFYLALATLGFLEITQIMIEEFPNLTGGIRGMIAARPTLFGWKLASDLALYYAVMPIVAALVALAWNLLHSPVGRAFDAIRNSTLAAHTLGISPARTKLTAFAIAALYAGLAGGLAAAIVGFIDPVEYGTSASLRHVTFIVVGGIGSLAGSLVGAVVLTLLPELLRGVHEYGDFVYAALLLAFLILMPKGLVGLWPLMRQLVSRDDAAPGSALGVGERRLP
ncbi:MAG: branched-chain amino acid ABC transporter permease [Alphaproteobacteria bacterium]